MDGCQFGVQSENTRSAGANSQRCVMLPRYPGIFEINNLAISLEITFSLTDNFQIISIFHEFVTKTVGVGLSRGYCNTGYDHTP